MGDRSNKPRKCWFDIVKDDMHDSSFSIFPLVGKLNAIIEFRLPQEVLARYRQAYWYLNANLSLTTKFCRRTCEVEENSVWWWN